MEFRKRTGEKKESLLEESARLFALSGGWRMPGVKLDLSKARWLCLNRNDKSVILESGPRDND